jgi:hypothetical protein
MYLRGLYGSFLGSVNGFTGDGSSAPLVTTIDRRVGKKRDNGVKDIMVADNQGYSGHQASGLSPSHSS